MPSRVYLPESGDIISLDLNPRTGHEQSGRRPCLVLSERLFTERTGLVVVCPITSRMKGFPFEIILEDTKTVGAILPIHTRSVDIAARYPKFIERAPGNVLIKSRAYVQAIIGVTDY